MMRSGFRNELAIMALVACAACGKADASGDAGGIGGVLAGVAAAAPAAAPAPAAPDRSVEIIDRLGFERPMTVGRLSVPGNWRTEGGVNWDGSTPCASNQMKFQWRAVAPDGVEAIEFLPGYSWMAPSAYIQMNPCPVDRIGSAQQLLEMVARAMRPGARIAGYRSREDLVAAMPRNPQGGRNELGELRIAYAVQGRPVEEVLSALVTLHASGGTAGYIVGYRAPAGRLDTARFERMRASFKGEPSYVQAIGQRGQAAITRHAQAQSAAIASWHSARMAEINAKGAADRAAIRAQGNAETNAIYAATARDTSATNDRIYEANRRALNEQTTWSNPNTGQTVQGSIHGGERVLGMSDGSFVRTDDPYYSPAGSTEYTPD